MQVTHGSHRLQGRCWRKGQLDALCMRLEQRAHAGVPSWAAGQAGRTCACLPCTEKKGASNRWYSTSFPKRPGVPCRPTGQRRSFSVTMSVPDTRFSQNPVGLSDSGNLRTGGSSSPSSSDAASLAEVAGCKHCRTTPMSAHRVAQGCSVVVPA